MSNYRTVRRRFLNICQALVAMVSYGFPQRDMTLIGVTGTDGKTTTTHYIANIIQASGLKVGRISTLGADINGQPIDTGLHTSTPGPAQIYHLLHLMKQAGVRHVVIETTSHGLHQYRTFGLRYKVGLITNLSPEHLDYHQTIDHYLAAKALIIKQSDWTIINLDSQPLQQLARRPSIKTFSLDQSADYQAIYNSHKSYLSLTHPSQPLLSQIHLNLPGRYNAANALAATAVALTLAIEVSPIKRGLESLDQLDGRWQIIQKQPFTMIVDFAHTPQALVEVLDQSKQLVQANCRLIHVFGSAAQRDKTKRAIMGQISGQRADWTILTMEDPRFESLDDIQAMIAQGLVEQGRHQGQHWQRIDDRQQAINQAVAMAKAGDVVLITGKGHERSLAIKGQEIPWSDTDAVKKALASHT